MKMPKKQWKSLKSILSSTLLLSTALLGMSCQTQVFKNDLLEPRREDVSNNVYSKKIIQAQDNNDEIELIVYSFDKENVNASFYYDKQPRLLSEWLKDSQDEIVINGVFFKESYDPTGWLIVDNKEIQSYKYAKDRSAIIQINNGRIDIVDTSNQSENKLSQNIAQTFPVLIRDGKSAIKEDSGKIARRTILAENGKDRVLIILLDSHAMSLYQTANVLEQSDLDIVLALNLDGGPSSGLISKIKGLEYESNPLTPIPHIIGFSAHDAADQKLAPLEDFESAQ